MQSIAAVEQRFIADLSHLYTVDEIKQLYYLLIADRKGWSRTHYLLNRGAVLGEDDAVWLRSCLSDLQTAKPVQYVLGHAWFMGMKLSVSPAVLIPRPETEELVQLLIDLHNANPSPLRIIDIGTGSGCIAIALKKALPHAHVYALDVSADALQLAQQNAAEQSTPIDFVLADILEWEVIFQDNQRFDIVVSNPPYITEDEQKDMHPNVLTHEPHLALFVAGKAPLLFYDHIAAFAQKHLLPNGGLYFEINRMYGKETSDLLRKKGFSDVQIHHDIHGAQRMVSAKN